MPEYNTLNLREYAIRLVQYGAYLLDMADGIIFSGNRDYDELYTKQLMDEVAYIAKAKYHIQRTTEEKKIWDELIKNIMQVTEKTVE